MHKDSVAHQYCMGAFAQASEAANGPIPVLARVLKLGNTVRIIVLKSQSLLHFLMHNAKHEC